MNRVNMNNQQIADYVTIVANKAFEQEAPEEYKKIISENKYNYNWFTFDKLGVAVYIEPKNRDKSRNWSYYGYMINGKMYGEISSATIKNYSRSDPVRVEGLVGKDIINQPVVSGVKVLRKRPNEKNIIEAVNDIGESVGVNKIPTVERGINPFFHPIDILNLSDKIIDINILEPVEYFNGLIREYTYDVSGNLDLNQFLLAVRRSLIQRAAEDIKGARIPTPNRYSIKIFYRNALGRLYRLSIARGVISRVVRKLHRIQLYGNLSTEIQEQEESGVTEVDFAKDYIIDTSQFLIQVTDFYRAGAGDNNTKQEDSELTRKLKEKEPPKTHSAKGRSLNLSWGKVRDFYPFDKGCFITILEYVLNKYKIRPPGLKKGYKKLWEFCSPNTAPITLTEAKRCKIKARPNGEMIDILEADRICKIFNMYLRVFNGDGRQIYRSKPGSEDVEVTMEDELPVCLNNNHYWLVEDHNTSKKEKKRIVEKPDGLRENPLHKNKKLFFDLETTYQAHIGSDGGVNPFMIGYCIDKNEVKVATVDEPSIDNIFDNLINAIYEDIKDNQDRYIKELEVHTDEERDKRLGVTKVIDDNPEVVDEYVDEEFEMMCQEHERTRRYRKLIKERIIIENTEEYEEKRGDSNLHLKYTLIAYNGSSFDFYFLLKYLLNKGYICVQQPNSSGIINSMVFFIDSKKLGNSGSEVKISVEVWDPFLFTHSSLEVAAENFGLQTHKTHTDHDKIQKVYQEGKLKEYLNENGKMIEEYCKNDVVVLRDLYYILEETIKKDYGVDITKYVTLPDMAYKIWLDMDSEGSVRVSNSGRYYMRGDKYYDSTKIAQYKRIVKAVKVKKHDECIREAIFGGRTHCIPGKWKGKFKMIDYISLYPAAMKDNYFPIGPEYLIQQEETLKEIIESDLIYIIYCEVDMSRCYFKDGSSPYPRREKGKPLDWNYKGVLKGYFTNVAINRLREGGAKITPIKDERNDIYGVYWVYKEKIFKTYIDKFYQIKKDEDDRKAQGLSYNKCRREMAKKMLNSLSGKMAQRNFTKKQTLTSDEFVVRNELLADDKAEFNPIVQDYAFVTREDKEAYSNPHPSHIAALIYDYAKVFMDRILTRYVVYYSDTDSAVILESDYQELEKEGLIAAKEKKIGMFECECDGEILSNGAKKLYLLTKMIKDKEEIVKCGMKGVRSRDVMTIDKYKKLIIGRKEDPITHQKEPNNIIKFFETLFNDKEVTISTWQFKRQIKNVSVNRCSLNKTIKLEESVEESIALKEHIEKGYVIKLNT